MNNFRKFLSLLFCSFCFIISTDASHLVVGEMSYKFMGNNTYLVTLTYYRDCINGNPSALINDGPTCISVYKGNNLYLIDSNIAEKSHEILPQLNPNSCLTSQVTSCIDKIVFEKLFTLPPSAEAYTIINQRCCMSQAINNIDNASLYGQSFYCKIPPSLSANNSSAVFNAVENVQFCINKKYTINNFATDEKGDSLSYEFQLLDNGGSEHNPKPRFLGSTLPLISQINYASNYSVSNPMPGISINQQTGIISFNPTMQGTFAFSLACDEWRNSIKINTVKRTYVYTVSDCNFDVSANVLCDHDLFEASNGKFCLSNCENKTINFKNSSIGALSYHWDFGVNVISTDTSNAFEPSYTYTDTGLYRVVLYANGANCTDSIVEYISISTDYVSTDFNVLGKFCTGSALQFMSTSTSNVDVISFWKWNFKNGGHEFSSTLMNPQMLFHLPGNYIANLKTYSRKEKPFQLSAVNVQAFEDLNIVKGKTINLTATGADSFKWNTPFSYISSSINQSSISYVANLAGSFVVNVIGTNLDGCNGTDSLTINVSDGAILFVPTAFSPDGNRLVGFDLKYFRVYNRRGQQVFETNDMEIGWNGKFRDKELGIDTYYWVACVIGEAQQQQVSSNSGQEQIFKGDVTLIR
jgi:hypothetical protein